MSLNSRGSSFKKNSLPFGASRVERDFDLEEGVDAKRFAVRSFKGSFGGLGHGGGEPARAREGFGSVAGVFFEDADREDRLNFIAILVNGSGRVVAVLLSSVSYSSYTVIMKLMILHISNLS